MKRRAIVLLLAACAAGLPGAAAAPPSEDAAASQKSAGIFSLFVENDLLAGTDRDYTNGFKAMWVSPELGPGERQAHAPRWLDFLSRTLTPAGPGSKRFFSLALVQMIFTPSDISRTDRDPYDRPYAGYLYFGFGFHGRDAGRLDTVEIDLGLVGPHSLAADMQKLWHKIFGFQRPMGWPGQIKDEFVLALGYDHAAKIVRSRGGTGSDRDAIVHAGASLSNAVSAAGAGVEFRWGWNLPADFGSSHIQPGSDSSSLFEERGLRVSGRDAFGFHFFLALEGRAVLRNIFLDGNTFRRSPSVDKYPLVGEAVAGFALRWKRMKFSLGYVFETREFTTQRRAPIFGSINLSFTLAD